MHPVITRLAKFEDARSIMLMARPLSEFAVSPNIKFYEQEELEEWAADPRNNVLAIAERDGHVTGFFFCKIMSWHWAMLDNFYVHPDTDAAATAKRLWQFLREELGRRKIAYLTTLVEEGRTPLRRLLRVRGFSDSKCYRWMELFLADKP